MIFLKIHISTVRTSFSARFFNRKYSSSHFDWAWLLLMIFNDLAHSIPYGTWKDSIVHLQLENSGLKIWFQNISFWLYRRFAKLVVPTGKLVQKNMIFCTRAHHTTSTRRKSGLRFTKLAGNTINRKIIIFYIEAMPQNIFQHRRKIFFRAWQKYFESNLSELGVGCEPSSSHPTPSSDRLPSNITNYFQKYFCHARKNIFRRCWRVVWGIASV